MKNILLATTALVMSAGFASAEITFSGTATAGWAKDGGATKKAAEKLTEAEFRFALNQDPMATEKLAEGIRGFVADQNKLEAALSEKL